MREIRTTCPRDCYDSCGMRVRLQDDGSYVVFGDDVPINRGRLCGKCAIWFNDPGSADAHRVTVPLRRTGPKGRVAFEPVSWDAALAICAERLDGVGARIVHSHYDGARGVLAREFPLRLLNALGASGFDPATVCHSAAIAGLEQVFGKGAFTVDPRELDSAEAVVLWGVNPAISAPHAWRAVRRNGERPVMHVNPMRTESVGAGDVHIPVRPGGDAALCFAVMRLLLEEGGIDHGFLERWTEGFGELARELTELDLERTLGGAGVEAAQARVLANTLRTRRTVIWIGMGVQRQALGGNLARSVALLPVLSGNMFKTGAGLLYLNGLGRRGIDKARIAGSPPPGAAVHSHADFARVVADPDRTRVLVTWNNNVAVSSPDSVRLAAALSRDDLFHVQLERRLTRTSLYADLVLPVADWNEYDDLVYSYLNLSVSAQTKFREPPGACLSNQEIFRRLARAMGLSDPWLLEDDRAVLDALVGSAFPGHSFGELRADGTWMLPRETGQAFAAKLLEGGRRIAIASRAAETAGAGRLPRPLVEPDICAGRFRVLSPGAQWRTNSSLTDNPRLLRKHEPLVWISTCDACDLGIQGGEPCLLHNANGSVRRIAMVTDRLGRGVLCVHKCEDFGTDSEYGLLNALMPGIRSDVGGCVAFQSLRADLTVLPPGGAGA